jgi:hypothetical protein
MAQEPSENFASTEHVARDILIQVFRAYLFDLIECGFYEGQVVNLFETVGPVVGRVVVESKMSPSTHEPPLPFCGHTLAYRDGW